MTYKTEDVKQVGSYKRDDPTLVERDYAKVELEPQSYNAKHEMEPLYGDTGLKQEEAYGIGNQHVANGGAGGTGESGMAEPQKRLRGGNLDLQL